MSRSRDAFREHLFIKCHLCVLSKATKIIKALPKNKQNKKMAHWREQVFSCMHWLLSVHVAKSREHIWPSSDGMQRYRWGEGMMSGKRERAGKRGGPSWEMYVDGPKLFHFETNPAAVKDWRVVSILEERTLARGRDGKMFLISGLNHPADKKMFLSSSGNGKQKYLLHRACLEREREKERISWR